MTNTNSSKITLSEAKELTHLNLVSAGDISSELGRTYHSMEEDSESKSHASARSQGVEYFCSIGYQVFPEGVGIQGIFTLADFLATREGRIVFVEVLSDTNIVEKTIERKSQLQRFGELCFIFFSGTKRSDASESLAAKRAVASWADVLYCRLHGYSGNHIQFSSRASVSYDTTRERGIQVALVFNETGRKLAISIKFLTHLYLNPTNTSISYFVGTTSYRYEEIFLDLFERLSHSLKLKVKRRSEKIAVLVRAMRRESGLALTNVDGQVVARMRSEYRGEPIERPYAWTHHPSSMDLPPDDFYGVFILEKTGPDGLNVLLRVFEDFGLTVKCDSESLTDSLIFLQKQAVRKCVR